MKYIFMLRSIHVVIKLIAILPGLISSIFGYFIFFRKKYSLINGFEADFKSGIKNESYAKRVGLIEFVLGLLLLITGTALIILDL